MCKKSTENKHDFFWAFTILFILIFICVPWIVNSLLDLNIKTATGVGNAEWLGFWGAYVGSALGVFVTFLAFTLTYRQNARQNEDIKEQNKSIQEQNKIILEQNADARELAKEQMRLQTLPFINIIEVENKYPSSIISLDNDGNINAGLQKAAKTAAGLFCLVNIGVAPAIDVKISSKALGHFSVSQEKIVSLVIPELPGYIETVAIFYTDREERKYKQTLKLIARGKNLSAVELAPPRQIEI